MEPPEKCKELFAMLSEYLDMELPPEACREMESHLEGCAPCVEFVESLKKTMAICKQYKPEELPKPLSDSARRDLEAAYKKMLAERGA